ncbi:MAG TPA: exodeoxyribonuclease V subunit alpha [Acidimicrobiales bacterium]|jgi:exodeoxyribonuclease V alpha subunit|nr:exodeoxyribonuclease V subunit alpha [Acidimicrobiales bacterium]
MTRRRVAVPAEVAVLAPFVEAGIFESAEVQFAAALVRLAHPLPDPIVVALALAARGPRLGHVCVELADVADTVVGLIDDEVVDLPWPDLADWVGQIEASTVVATPAHYADEPFLPLVWDGRRLYLQRFWDYEVSVADVLRQRSTSSVATDEEGLAAALDEVFGPADEVDLQCDAVRVALTNQVSVIAGGPGTGKTRTIARLLSVARLLAERRGHEIHIALAAPTGKAASRMTEAVQREAAETLGRDLETAATTLHTLLGWAPGTRTRHDLLHPLPHDLVVIDETSMVPLQLMAKLLRALKPTARLVLVGDPYQLASVEAGSVLDDLVGPSSGSPPGDVEGPLQGRVTSLRRMHRYDEASSIAALADAVRRGDVEATFAILSGGHPDVHWIQPDDASALASLRRLVIETAADVVRAALAGQDAVGLAAAHRVKVLCATRRGPMGLFDWSDQIEAGALAAVPGATSSSRWFAGLPVMVTANDSINGLFNGDVGLVVRGGANLEVALQAGAEVRHLPTSRLDRFEPWWAMTIHKSQGSEFPHAVASLPTRPSPILSRELLYTAVTRGREALTIVASEAAIHSAVSRPAARASGLGERLWTAVAHS